MRQTAILALAAAFMASSYAGAQTLLDVGSLRELDDAEIVAPDGSEVGEIEDVLIDTSGRPVAIVVEVDGGFLDLDEDEFVFSFDQLTYQNGNYVTELTAEQIELLPRFDD